MQGLNLKQWKRKYFQLWATMDQMTEVINQFLAANLAAAAKMGKYTMAARQMVEGKAVGAMNTGGMPSGAA